MGSVFLAEDVALGRRVAIKLVRDRLAGGSQGEARFLREARALASVEHAGIVRLYAFGEADGRPYFVMELVEGETLADRLRREGPFPLAETVAILSQVVDALEAAWEKGIVHRDVKPSNILVDAKGRVHVADFGLAKPVRGPGDGDLSLTGDGLLVGTPAYLAPEQARGLGVDFRTDVYSLGCVLYEMLAAVPPFQGPSVLAVVDQHLHSPFPSLREKRPDLARPVADLVDRMTRREPEERPASYAELRSRIAALGDGAAARTVASAEKLAGRPERAPAPLPPDAGPRSVRPSRRTVAVALALAALVAVSLAVLWTGRSRGPSVRAVPAATAAGSGGFAAAVAPFHGPDAESAREGRVMAALVEKELVHRLKDVRVVGLDTVAESPRSAEDARRLGRRLGVSVVIWGDVLTFQGETEIQPSFTLVPHGTPDDPASLVAPGGARPTVEDAFGLEARSPGPVRLVARAPDQVELRRTSAAGIGDTVLLLAALHALHVEEDPLKALTLAEEAPRSMEALRIGAEALRLMGRPGEAGSRLDEALRLAPEEPASEALLAEWLLEAGRLPEAAATFASAQKRTPGTITRAGALFEGKLYRQDVPDPDPDGSGPQSCYLVAVDPGSGRVVERHLLPGIPLSFAVRGSALRVSYAPGVPPEEAVRALVAPRPEVEIAGGRVLGPCALPPMPIQRVKTMKCGWTLAVNFSVGRTVPGSPAWDGRPARLVKTEDELDPRAPKTLAELEAALRAASVRDPTQPWHLFFLGQALRAQGRAAESETVFGELFGRSFPGIGWYEWSWMAAFFERAGQTAWTDRAIEVASVRRKEVLPPPSPGALIERLIGGTFMRSGALALEMPPLRRHELLRRARLLTGPTIEGDDAAALLWARFLRGAGLEQAAAEEERVGRELTRSSANASRISGVVHRGLVVLAAAAASGVGLVLLIATQFAARRRAGRRAGAPSTGRRAVLTVRERRALGVAAVVLSTLVSAHQVLRSRNEAFVSGWVMGMQDALGHPYLAAALEARAGPGADPGLVFLAATARHLEGDAKAARALYRRIQEKDPRAAENLLALGRREPPRRFPGLRDYEGAAGALNPREALAVWPWFLAAALFVALLALLPGVPAGAPVGRPNPWAGRLVPGLLDVGLGRPLRAWATWSLLSFALLAVLWHPAGSSMFLQLHPAAYPFPPGAGSPGARAWLAAWAVPADRLWWALVAAALAASLALHVRSVLAPAVPSGQARD